MAQPEEATSEVKKAQMTLAEAETKLRSAKNATERVEAQKLVRAAQEQVEKAETAATAAATTVALAAPPSHAPAATAAPAPAPAIKKHVVKKGESLSLIAKQYYGDVHKWKQIYEANKAVVGDNPDLIKPGQELVIP